jgi:hypothetical protein
MRRLLAVAVLLSLVATGTALANHLEPRKNIRPADQARARAMLLKKADLGLGYRAQPPSGQDVEVDCAAVDESDLTLTGEAESPTFTLAIVFISSLSAVYESAADANASWKRETSPAGTKCLRGTLRREFAKGGLRLVSLRPLSFPRVAQKTVAYRIVLAGQAQGVTVRAFVDFVVLMHSRAQAALLIGSAVSPVDKPEEVRLAGLVAGRMEKAMRSS